ncbi:MAG: hypothetical protein BGO01_00610 [Armatimonadetes bacterium 55-13]|nr:MAG: hypothetical protein BGO01_00610 [Armatimonadetes bacterium 55-13]
MEIIDRITTFKQASTSFSYRLAKTPASRFTFEPYWEGYKDRRNKISSLLLSTNNVMISLDFKKFYHNLDPHKVAAALKAHLVSQKSLSRTERWAQDYVVGFLESRPTGSGLPVGSDLSHFLADLYLEKFDEIVGQKFPGCYFRYVDDLAIVVNAESNNSVQEFVESTALKSGGMEINPDKSLVYDSQKWMIANSYRNRPPEATSYSDLVYRLRVYRLKGGSIEELEAMMGKATERLPIRRLTECVTDPEYQMRVRTHFDEGHEFAIRAHRTELREMPELASKAAEKIKNQIDAVAEDENWTQPEIKPYIERYLRTLANQSLFLADESALRRIKAICERKGTSAEFRACVDAIVDQNIAHVLHMPGRAQHAVVELLGKTGVKKMLAAFLNSYRPEEGEKRNAILASLCELSAAGCGDVDFSNLNLGLDEMKAIDAFRGQFDRKSLVYDGSYTEEVGSLLSGLEMEDRLRMLWSQRYDGEIQPIFTTKLDGIYYS